MIKLFEKIKKTLGSSLRFTLLTALVVSLLSAALSYFCIRVATDFYISQYYTSEENRIEREIQYAKQLQDYITRNKLSSVDVEEISHRAIDGLKSFERENQFLNELVEMLIHREK